MRLHRSSPRPHRRGPSPSERLFWYTIVPITIVFSAKSVYDSLGNVLSAIVQSNEATTSHLQNMQDIIEQRQKDRNARKRKDFAKQDRFFWSQLALFGGETNSTIQHNKTNEWVEPPYWNFDYSQPAQRTATTLPNPKVYHRENTVVIVLSARENIERRKTIRETWGKNHSVYFVIGGERENETKTIQQSLQTEFRTNQDLLDTIHPDGYRSLPYKLRFAYRWIIKHIPTCQWFIKVDDDTVVRVDSLQQALLRPLNPRTPLVLGRIVVDAPVHREGKWAELKYQPAKYPYWPQGSCGHVVSRPVASYIARLPNITYYQGEDTSVGIWLDQSDLHVTWLHSMYFVNDRNCMEQAWLIIGHQITPEEMVQCYRKADEWSPQDVTHRHKNLWFVETVSQRNYLSYRDFGIDEADFLDTYDQGKSSSSSEDDSQWQ